MGKALEFTRTDHTGATLRALAGKCRPLANTSDGSPELNGTGATSGPKLSATDPPRLQPDIRQGGVRRRLAQGPFHKNPRGGPDCLGENVGNGAARYSVRKTSMIVSWLKFTLRCIWRGILMPARMQ